MTTLDAQEITIATPGGQALADLIASLADNKAALGRRYGAWAVSAPTLEAAVAAAAMAQDELGHARSTYPLLKQLGLEGAEEDAHVEGGRNVVLLDADLPSWESYVAANLVLDGALTTFVEATIDSGFAPLAQRARKILQEERSHEVHAQAWTRRLAGDEKAARTRFAEQLAIAWEQAARWYGPADDASFAAAVEQGLVAVGPAELRARLRARLEPLLAAAPLAVALAEPRDWSGWSAARRR